MSAYEVKKYLQYKLKARNEHSIHSPFVFKLYTEVIDNKNKFYAYDELNKIRKELLRNNQTIEVKDLGAGSKKMSSIRKISDIAKHSVVNQKYSELLFRLTEFFKPKSILELGTSLGLSALHLMKAAPHAKIVSLEGCPNTFSFAKALIVRHAVLQDAGSAPGSKAEHETLKRVHGDGEIVLELVNLPFDKFFSETKANQTYDLIYIDGNHTYEATVKYFHELLKITNENSVLIFDDIYWSPGMTKAWEEIKGHPSVTVSIDLFKMGFIFFRKENKQKEHFCLRY
jgi:predicted O-methyltransferase YrrM